MFAPPKSRTGGLKSSTARGFGANGEQWHTSPPRLADQREKNVSATVSAFVYCNSELAQFLLVFSSHFARNRMLAPRARSIQGDQVRDLRRLNGVFVRRTDDQAGCC
jgi:hypothetical protein